VNWNDFLVEASGSLGQRGALLRLQCIGILTVAVDSIAGGHDFRGFDHRDVRIAAEGHEFRVLIDPKLHRLYQRDRLDATGDTDVHAVDQDLLGGGCDGHEAGRTLPVHRHAGHSHGQTRAQCCRAPDRLLITLGQGAAQQAIVDFGKVELRTGHRCQDGVRGERRRRGRVERAPVGASDRSSDGRNDDRVTHCGWPPQSRHRQRGRF
jgi:hypothetical protein